MISVVAVFMSVAYASAQERTINGVVKDATTLGVPGVFVLVEGTTNGTTTDLDGNFSISAPENSFLVFQCMGYKEVKKSVTGDITFIDVLLEEDSQLLEEVVVIGMGTQKRNTITAAVSTVNSDAIENLSLIHI